MPAGSYKISPKPFAPTLEPVASGVWLLRGGLPGRDMNVYLLADSGQVTLFDAGVRTMAAAIGRICRRMGGLRQVVLGHAHPDHRGAAAALGAPVLCHAEEVYDAEGDGGLRYFDLSLLEHAHARVAMPYLLRFWDGGPVAIAQTVAGGDDIAGFEVVELPGHSPGQIALWRQSDRLCLASDALYTLDPQTGRHCEPRLAHPAFNWDTPTARASVEKLKSLEPAEIWLGHCDPLTDNPASQISHAASG